VWDRTDRGSSAGRQDRTRTFRTISGRVSRERGQKGHAMAYKKEFKLNLSDIDIIETCLRKELHVRSEKYQELMKTQNAEEIDCAKKGVSEINELLGKIHNQKIWYTGDPDKPWVPQG
jgi:hypothetical protein